MDFERAWRLLEEAAVIGDGLTREEVTTGLELGIYRLWQSPNSAALTAEEGRTIRIGLAGGDLAELKTIEEQITDYAKSQNFTNVEIVGRPGWERELNYDRVAVVLRKNI